VAERYAAHCKPARGAPAASFGKASVFNAPSLTQYLSKERDHCARSLLKAHCSWIYREFSDNSRLYLCVLLSGFQESLALSRFEQNLVVESSLNHGIRDNDYPV
jgi:hypothetical protein